MSVDESLQGHWFRAQQTNGSIVNGGGGPQPPVMEADLAVLKQRADHADQRMARVEEKLDRIADRLGTVATRTDVEEGSRRAVSAAWNGLSVGGTIAVAIVALFVAVLAYLQDSRIAVRPEAAPSAAAAPIILTLRPWPSPPAAPIPLAPANPG